MQKEGIQMWNGMTSLWYGLVASVIIILFMALLQGIKSALWKKIRKAQCLPKEAPLRQRGSKNKD